MGAGLWLAGCLRLFGGELLAQLSGHQLAGLVGTLLDRCEVEFGRVTRALKHFLGKRRQKLLELRVLGNIGE